MPYNPNKHHRRSIRLPGYDYTSAGAYFVTTNTQHWAQLFGVIQDGQICLSQAGEIVWACWSDLPKHYEHVSLDAFIVMPDHVHGIIVLNDQSNQRHGLPEIVRAFKSFSARRINEWRRSPGVAVWQRNYYEHVIRDEQALERIRGYIITNPARRPAASDQV